jgi:hypothetical protein
MAEQTELERLQAEVRSLQDQAYQAGQRQRAASAELVRLRQRQAESRDPDEQARLLGELAVQQNVLAESTATLSRLRRYQIPRAIEAVRTLILRIGNLDKEILASERIIASPPYDAERRRLRARLAELDQLEVENPRTLERLKATRARLAT